MSERLTAIADVATATPERYAKQLASHLERVGARNELQVSWQPAA